MFPSNHELVAAKQFMHVVVDLYEHHLQPYFLLLPPEVDLDDMLRHHRSDRRDMYQISNCGVTKHEVGKHLKPWNDARKGDIILGNVSL